MGVSLKASQVFLLEQADFEPHRKCWPQCLPRPRAHTGHCQFPCDKDRLNSIERHLFLDFRYVLQLTGVKVIVFH